MSRSKALENGRIQEKLWKNNNLGYYTEFN